MKSSAFNQMLSEVFGVPLKTVTTYTRFLKEAGLLTTGARGVNAPHMTPLDAARVIIAFLSCDTPSQAVDRVKRFGEIRFDEQYSPMGYENIGLETFQSTFEGETLEQVLTFILSRYEALESNSASKWFREHDFSLKLHDFEVRAEFESWSNGIKLIVPFRGNPWDNHERELITGHIRTTRESLPHKLLQVSIALASGGKK